MRILNKIRNYLIYVKGAAIFRKREKLLKKQLYKQYEEKDLILVFNGLIPQGGLADRLKSILCIYAYAKRHSLTFGISHYHPFNLANFLNPKIDWDVKPGEIIYNANLAQPLLIPAVSYPLFKLKLRRTRKQKHIYSSGYFPKIFKEYGYPIGDLFNEIFEPSSVIKATIEYYKSEKVSWIAIHFRFLNLLGDFRERTLNTTLANNDQQLLIEKCCNFIKSKANPELNILVCSDSQKFIDAALKIQDVFAIEGNIKHIDNSQIMEEDFYQKTFIDFFMILNAKEIISVVANKMYASYFPVLASKISNIPFQKIQL